jgi:ribosomal protein S18 acetylase RimI-like enzyme
MRRRDDQSFLAPSEEASFADAIEMTKQSLLLDLFDYLMPKEGEFWYIEADGSEVMLPMGTEMQGIAMRAQATPPQADAREDALSSLPLLRYLRPLARSGFVWGTRGLALRALKEKASERVALRWVFGQRLLRDAVQWQAHLDAWAASSGLSRREGSHRLIHVEGAAYETLQEMIQLGQARAPGLLLLEPSHINDDLVPLLHLIELAALRGFWILLHLPRQRRDQSAILPAVYEAFSQDLREMRLSSWCVGVEDLSAGRWQRRPQSEWWVLSPHPKLAEFRQLAWPHLYDLFVQGLQRPLHAQLPQGLSSRLHLPSYTGEEDAEASRRLPQEVGFHLVVDQARTSDIKAVLRLWDALMDEHAREHSAFRRRPHASQYLHRSFLQTLHQPHQLLLVLRHQEIPVGFLSASILRSPLLLENRFGQLIDMYLEPRWRGRGYGSALVEAALAWFREQRIQQVEINVALHNAEGQRFWQRHGFQMYLSAAIKKL